MSSVETAWDAKGGIVSAMDSDTRTSPASIEVLCVSQGRLRSLEDRTVHPHVCSYQDSGFKKSHGIGLKSCCLGQGSLYFYSVFLHCLAKRSLGPHWGSEVLMQYKE